MAKERKCSYCGRTGHDARNCPAREADEPRDKVLWLRYSNISDREADKLLNAAANAKRNIANHAEVAFAKGDKKSLPGRVREALGLGSGEEDG